MAKKSTEQSAQSQPPAPVAAPVAPVQVAVPAPAPKGGGLAVTGFILALLGFLLGLIPFFPILIYVFAILFSAIGLKSAKKGLAIAGLVIAILGLLFNLAWSFGAVKGFQKVKEELKKELDKQTGSGTSAGCTEDNLLVYEKGKADFLPAELKELPPKTELCGSIPTQNTAFFSTKLSVPEIRNFYTPKLQAMAGCTFQTDDPDPKIVAISTSCDDGSAGGVTMYDNTDQYTINWLGA